MSEVTVNGVPDNKFKDDITITSAILGDKCPSVGMNAFENCTTLTSISVGKSIEDISSKAFANTGISSISILNNNCTVGTSTFYGCKNLINVTINCAQISDFTFENCSKLTEVNIPNCNNIGYRAFYGCNNLNKITLQKCVNIGVDAFNGNTKLNSVNLEQCKSLGNYAFANCKKLYSASLYKCESIGTSAFENCESLESINTLNTCKIIGDSAFKNCKILNSEGLNLNVCESIGTSAFENCESLNEISLWKCESIGKDAFVNCESLKKVNIYKTDGICKLNDMYVFCKKDDSSQPYDINTKTYFYVMSNIKADYLNDENWNFYRDYIIGINEDNQIVYESFYKVKLHDDFINKYKNYEHIENEIDDNDTYYGTIKVDLFGDITSNIFTDDDKKYIYIIDMPPNCEYIGNYIFDGYTSLSNIKLYNGLKIIGSFVFKNCESLEKFTIPNSVTELGQGIFAGCKNLKTVSGSINFIRNGGKAVVYDNKLIWVTPNDNSETYNISDIDKDITSLGFSCFYGCTKLKRVDIPSNITYIGSNCFMECKNLREVHMNSIKPPTISNNKVFGEALSDDLKIFIPYDSIKENDECEYFNNIWENYNDYMYFMPNENQIIVYGYTLNLKDSYQNDVVFLKTYDKFGHPDNVINYNGVNVYGLINDNKSIPFWLFNSFPSGNTHVSNTENSRIVILGKGIKEIEYGTFQHNSKLKYIYLNDDLEKIPDVCFYNCESLQSLHFPSSLESIGDEAFENCKDLQSLHFPSSLESIGDKAFENCTSLTEITLSGKICRLGNYCFGITGDGTGKTKSLRVYMKTDVIPVFYKDGEENEESYPFGEPIENYEHFYDELIIYVPNNLEIEYKTHPHWSKYENYIRTFE